MRSPAATADVAIVGAGFAGLTAARVVAAAGRTPIVLEATNRPGGRTDSQDLAPGVTVDMGGAYAGEDNLELLSAAREFGVEAVPVRHADGLELRLGTDGERIEAAAGKFEPETLRLVEEIDRLAGQVPCEAPWEAPDAGRLDSISFADWLEANASEIAAHEVAKPIRAFMGNFSGFSLLHLLFYSRSNGGVGTFLGIGERHDSLEFAGSVHSIARRMADSIGASIRYESPVTRISEDRRSLVIEAGRVQVRADRCIVACAPNLAGAIEFDPPLGHDREELMRRMPLLSVIKAQISYAEPFWRAGGMSGTGAGRLIETADASPRDDSAALLTVFTDRPEDTRRLAQLSPDDRRSLILTEVASLWGEPALHPIGYADRSWSAEQFSRGCIMSMPQRTWTTVGHAIRSPIGRIHWAGSETATAFCGNIEGAMRSASRAGAEAVEALP